MTFGVFVLWHPEMTLRFLKHEKNVLKSPIKIASREFVFSTTAQNKFWFGSYLLSLQLPYSPLLIQILARCDATDHTRHYWSPLVAVGRRGVLLAPSEVSAFFRSALQRLAKAKATHERIQECLSHWGINSHPDCRTQRLHCLLTYAAEFDQ